MTAQRMPRQPEGPPSWARVGAKVICVESDIMWDFPNVTPPQIGVTYTIDRVGLSAIERAPIIALVEHIAEDPEAGQLGFDIKCFRPAVEPKTEAEDLAKFIHHLDPLYVAMRADDIVVDA